MGWLGLRMVHPGGMHRRVWCLGTESLASILCPLITSPLFTLPVRHWVVSAEMNIGVPLTPVMSSNQTSPRPGASEAGLCLGSLASRLSVEPQRKAEVRVWPCI